MSQHFGGQGRGGPNRQGRGRGRGQRGGPPSGLSGREIGEYYKQLSQARKQEREKKERAVVSIDKRLEGKISQILLDVDSVQQSSSSSRGAEAMVVKKVEEIDSPDVVAMDTTPIAMTMTPPLYRMSSKTQDVPLTISEEQLKQELEEKRSYHGYQTMLDFRYQLPSWNMLGEILKAIEEHQVVVISGETGCGKTTQVSQFILDDAIMRGCGSKCHVISTQPRRISAISVAQRVAAERAESLGKSVGYQIRLEQVLPRTWGSILYCTTGVMVRRLISDPLLHQCSHLVLDEVHERNNISDFLTIIIKDILPQRPDLKLILMSATINEEIFSKYFNDAPIISIPGRVFPVQEYYLEDVLKLTEYQPSPDQDSRKGRPHWSRYGRGKQEWLEKEERQVQIEEYIDKIERAGTYPSRVTSALRVMNFEEIDFHLIMTLLRYVCRSMEGGAILVFLPGWDTISKLNDMLKADVMFRSPSHYLVIPLHSLMPTAFQKQVFDRPPDGVRKIVIATNIAETSITIDDVIYVIDCGKVKETTYDVANQLACLDAVWESKAAARQRRGRAGRVQSGHCFHLFTRHQYSQMAEFQLPEMLRTPLEELVLQIKVLRLGLAGPFLERALEPPPAKAVNDAIKLLKNLRALTTSEELTSLGYHIANLPVHPRVGKIILFGAMFSCLDPVLTIASTLGFKEPFVIPLHKQDEADRIRRRFAGDSESDHIALLNAFRGWERSQYHGNTRQYCWDNFLSSNTLGMLSNMKRQFASLLKDTGFVNNTDPKDASVNINSDNLKLVKAILCAGLYPNVAKITPGKRSAKLYTQQDGKVKFHPKSVNCEVPQFKSQFLIYHTKVKSSAIFIHDASIISPLPLLFFGGDITVHDTEGTVSVDKWIVFQASKHTAEMVKDMRRQLDVVLEEKISQPDMVLYSPSDPSPCSQLIQAIIDLITSEDYTKQHERLAQGKHLYPHRK